SLRAVRKATALPIPHGMDMPEIHWLKATPPLALARFGRWDELLREPDPGAGQPFESALWHFARGLAFARKRPLPDAEREAEAVYRADLKRHPANGWSLFGLLQCQRALGRTEAAAETEKRFREAWRYADVALTGSCF